MWQSHCAGLEQFEDGRIKFACPLNPDHVVVGRPLGRIYHLLCLGDCPTDQVLGALGLTQSDLTIEPVPPPPQESPPFAQGSPQSDFSAQSDHPHHHTNGNGKPHVDAKLWKLTAYHIVRNLLEHDYKQNPQFIASASAAMLLEGALKDLRRGLAAGKLDPLPDLSESELDEELEVAAHGAVKDFMAEFTSATKSPEKEEPEAKITALRLDQLYEVIDQWDRQPWVWDGILPHSSLSLIVGKSETGKSTLIYSLIYAIVTGTEFFGRTCEQGRVLYLAGDPMSEIVAGKTFRELGLQDGVVVVPDALCMYPTGMTQIRTIVADLKPCLVVGDTLAATIEIDVDSYGQSYRSQMPLTRMARDFGPNFLMSHHSQKSAIDSYGVIDAALGSVGVAAVASSRMSTKLYRRKGQKYFTFEMSNLRIGKPLAGESIVHKLDNGLVELAGLWKVQNTEMDKSLIIDVLGRQSEPLAKRTLWQELRPKPKWDPFNDAIEELFAEGKIKIQNGPRGGKLFALRSD